MANGSSVSNLQANFQAPFTCEKKDESDMQTEPISLKLLGIVRSMSQPTTTSKRSVKNANKLGVQVERNLRLNGIPKNHAKLIGKLVSFLGERAEGKNETIYINNDGKGQLDSTGTLNNKKHLSKISFYFERLLQKLGIHKPSNKDDINRGINSLKAILSLNENLKSEFWATLKKEKEIISFLALFPMNVEKTKYPEFIQIGDQKLKLKNVPADGNCAFWAIKQLTEPLENFYQFQQNDPDAARIKITGVRKAMSEFAQEKGASEDVVTRIRTPNECLEVLDFKYFAQKYNKDIVICIFQNEKLCFIPFSKEGALLLEEDKEYSYNPEAWHIYLQNEHFQVLLPENTEK